MTGRKNKKTPILFLAGGQGTRLRSINPDRPKPMIEVKGFPFLHWLVDYYTKLGVTDFVISTGYKAEVIETYPWEKCFSGTRFRFSRENEPLGTGGATHQAFEQFKLDEAWVVNADTFLPVELPKSPSKSDADVMFMALAPHNVFDANPNLRVMGDRVVSQGKEPTLFDAGAVFIAKAAIEHFQKNPPYSLMDMLVPAMDKKRVKVEVVEATCFDIGTPERFARFERYLERT
jgi:D-glycero-alpha-D-manno-heptose 1-phosphate guanylyltransferase